MEREFNPSHDAKKRISSPLKTGRGEGMLSGAGSGFALWQAQKRGESKRSTSKIEEIFKKNLFFIKVLLSLVFLFR
jgi:hypothetical protein